MGQVAPLPMQSDAATVAGAIMWAYGQLKGEPPPRVESWLWPLALSSNETAAWRDPRSASNKAGLYNWNLGNVTTNGSGVDWYLNPAVTNGLKFASYPDAGAGALAMMKVLDHLGGLAAADAGDWNAWQVTLSKYLGSSYPDLSALVSRLSSTVPAPYGPGSALVASASSIVKPLVIAGGVFVLACLLSEAINPGSSPLSPKGRRALGFS